MSYKVWPVLFLIVAAGLIQSCKSIPKTERKYAGIHHWTSDNPRILIVVAPQKEDNRLSTLNKIVSENSLANKEKVVQTGVNYLFELLNEDSGFTPILIDSIRFSLVDESEANVETLLSTYHANAIIALENYVITKKEIVQKVGGEEQVSEVGQIHVHWTIVSADSINKITDTVTVNTQAVGSGAKFSVKDFGLESSKYQGLIKFNVKELYRRLRPWEDEVFRRYYLSGTKLLTSAKKELKNGNIDAAQDLILAQINVSKEKLANIDPNNLKREEKGLQITEGERLARTYHDYAACLELKGDLENALTYSTLALSFFNAVPDYTLFEIDYLEELDLLLKHQELRKIQLRK